MSTLPTGDRGQRYEIHFFDHGGADRRFGWTDKMRGVRAMVESINLHPSMFKPYVIDRTDRVIFTIDPQDMNNVISIM